MGILLAMSHIPSSGYPSTPNSLAIASFDFVSVAIHGFALERSIAHFRFDIATVKYQVHVQVASSSVTF